MRNLLTAAFFICCIFCHSILVSPLLVNAADKIFLMKDVQLAQLNESELKNEIKKYRKFIGGPGMPYFEFETENQKWEEIINNDKYRVNNINNFKVIKQGEYKTGCESAATTALLNHLGYKISLKTFVDKYLPTIKTCDEFYNDKNNKNKLVYDYYFVGDPKSDDGTACNAPVIMTAIERYFKDINETKKKPVNLTGSDFSVLIDKLQEGKHVLIWLSIDLSDNAKTFTLGDTTCYYMRHTGVLVGVDENNGKAYFADSLSGKIEEWPIQKVKDIYVKYGSQAVVIE